MAGQLRGLCNPRQDVCSRISTTINPCSISKCFCWWYQQSKRDVGGYDRHLSVGRCGISTRRVASKLIVISSVFARCVLLRPPNTPSPLTSVREDGDHGRYIRSSLPRGRATVVTPRSSLVYPMCALQLQTRMTPSFQYRSYGSISALLHYRAWQMPCLNNDQIDPISPISNTNFSLRGLYIAMKWKLYSIRRHFLVHLRRNQHSTLSHVPTSP